MIEVDFVYSLKNGKLMPPGIYNGGEFVGTRYLKFLDLGLDNKDFLRRLKAFSPNNARYYSLSGVTPENESGIITVDYWRRAPKTDVESMDSI